LVGLGSGGDLTLCEIMWQIGKTEYVNFLPFEQATFDFSQPGLTVIEALVKGRRGCDSNGGGKSALLEGPVWAAFGRCIRPDYKVDDVVHLDSREGCMVRFQLLWLGKPKAMVTRYWKHPTEKNTVRLEIDGKDVTRGTNTETERAIEEMLGMDYYGFVNNVMFCAREDVKSFFAATDAERKKLLERLLGLEVYAAAEKVSRARARSVAEALSAKRAELDAANAVLAERKEQAARAGVQESAAEVEMRIREIRVALQRLDKQRATVEGRRAAAVDELGKARETFRAVQHQFAEKLAVYERERQVLYEDYQRKQDTASQILGKYRALQVSVQRVSKLGGQCPTCLQDVSAGARDAAVASVQKAIAELGFQSDAAQMDADMAKTAWDSLVAPTPPVETPEMVALDYDITGYVESLRELAVQKRDWLLRLNQEQATLERIQDAVASAETQVRDADAAVQAVLGEIEVMERDLAVLEFWVEGFGNKGLKSYLIEAALPEINQLATTYAQRLLGSGSAVRLRATRVLKTRGTEKEEMSVEGSIPGCTRKYAGASKGQKKRLDLCLLLALRDMVVRRSAKRFNQLFVDEIFDGTDRSGCEAIAELLRETSETCPVALITHAPILKGIGDRTVTVCHSGTKAVIMSGRLENSRGGVGVRCAR
jgi:DNA repair exonuclease SbcCD ATPase subunit